MENSTDSFAVFILTHGRPNNVITYRMLRKGGYTGDIYIVIDNEDESADEYYKLYGDKVIMFDKAAIAETFDEADNFNDRRAVVYARNACFQIARDLGVEYFLQLDDDYTDFRFLFDFDLVYNARVIYESNVLDGLFSTILKFYKGIPAVVIAMGQTGDLIGGPHSKSNKQITTLRLNRKAMNTFFCSVKRPFTFIGRINEDVNTYVLQGNRGDLFLTFFSVIINQLDSQKRAGGMTELYLNSGTYIKSFYTVMLAPSCVKVAGIGNLHHRLHHRISWNNAVPKIMDEQYCKRLTPERTTP